MLITPFPHPLPGECLYSVFCRYHVRSGNHTGRQTSLDLFDQGKIALATSITTPTLVYMSCHWGVQDMGMDTIYLVKEHSAFQYYAVGMSSYEQEKHWRAISIGFRRKRLLADKNRTVAHRCRRLRYCPDCAEGERNLYGEAYWHTVHQLEGVSHCPLHKVPLVESEAEVWMANRNYLPADFIISKLCASENIGSEEEEIPGLSNDIIWLLENGAKLGGAENVIAKYLKDPDVSLAEWLTREQSSDYNNVHKGTEEQDLKKTFQKYTPLQHAIYMRRRYGGAAKFQKEHI